ncbi:uncharacterized protein CEXT_544731 [Caerostris extrusa]|uniref:Uncharacterized protein n=1 Tax=Caerostris extrusa TaxID=172846 RepID=A0AAV4TKR3_CAEEX|nr:uncharacterized protein CEXT_544731 [Caerostris extrusa]
MVSNIMKHSSDTCREHTLQQHQTMKDRYQCKRHPSLPEELPSPPEFDSSRTGIKEPKPIPRNKNNTSSEFPKRKRAKFSRQYDPTGKTDNGFVPIPSPYAGTTPPRNAQRRARIRNHDELVVKESRQSPNILGNGNFEILGGGNIFR